MCVEGRREGARERERDKDIERQRQRQRLRHTDRQRQRETETKRQRHRGGHRERQTEQDRKTDIYDTYPKSTTLLHPALLFRVFHKVDLLPKRMTAVVLTWL